MQAGILAMAGIITRIIGLLYRSPLNSIIGEAGMGYYQEAYGFYAIILIISSYSIPSAMSKVIAQKLAVREYRNAHRLFKCALAYTLVVGGVGSLFLFFGAGIFVAPEAVSVLRVFAPTIFVYGILGVLRGYFQAHKSMVQTSLSQIIEQIINAIVSISAAYLWIKIMMGPTEELVQKAVTMHNEVYDLSKVSMGDHMALFWGSYAGCVDRHVEAGTAIRKALYGASGSALGTGAGVFTGLLFMLLVYMLNRKMIQRRVERDRHAEVDSYGKLIKKITMVVTPFILSTAVYQSSAAVNNLLYNRFLPMVKNVDTLKGHNNYGIFSGQSLTVSNIPIAFASAMAAAMIPMVAQLIASRDIEEAKDKIGTSVKTTMLISIPSAVGLCFLAKPVMYLLFPRPDEIVTVAGRLLMALSPSVIFYALSTLNGQILQGLGKVKAPIINATIALVLQSGLACVLLFYTKLDLYSLAIVNTFYSGLMCLLNQYSVRKAIGYKQEIKRTFLIPLGASLIMGVAAWLTYHGLYYLIHSFKLASQVSLIPAIGVGVLVYFVVLILMKGVTEQELRTVPKGYLIVKVAKKVHLM